MVTMTQLNFCNTFSQLPEALYNKQAPKGLDKPFIVSTSQAAAKLIGLSEQDTLSQAFLDWTSGNATPPGAEPLAMVYSGHQFGGYSPQLGDGRGLLLGEVNGPEGKWDIHLKGAGKTPYSRFGDGRAVLRSSIREYLCSEAMAGLGIPTTRALCVVGSETPVQREQVETGAMITRLAKSHIRFGHFEYCHYTNQHDLLKTLLDYVIAEHFPGCLEEADTYRSFFRAVIAKTAKLIAHWQAIGFAHGVMNTDNMSIIGDTFDYGPYAFLDDFEPGFICNHSDHQGRYAFDRQPSIALWNLNALASSLSTFMDKETLREELDNYQNVLIDDYAALLRQKLGLETEQEKDRELFNNLFVMMQKEKADFTLTFRRLCDFETAQTNPLRDHFVNRELFDQWAQDYETRLQKESLTSVQRQDNMRRHNPKFILRNYLAQQAIEQAEAKDFTLVNQLVTILAKPYDEHPGYDHLAELPEDSQKHLEISCSS